MSDKDKVVALLLAAEKRVKQGWCQGDAGDANGNVCALGAIDAVQADYSFLYYVASRAVNVYLRQQGWPTVYNPIIDYNDTPNRTKEEVMGVLHATALAVRAGDIEV